MFMVPQHWLDLPSQFSIKTTTYSAAVQPNHLQLSGFCLSVTEQHIQTSLHGLYGECCLHFHSFSVSLFILSWFVPSSPVLFWCGFQSSGAQDTLSI